MNTSKIALYTNPDEVLTLTPSESIISMFEHTDENGTLYIPEWLYDSNCDNTEHFYIIRFYPHLVSNSHRNQTRKQ